MAISKQTYEYYRCRDNGFPNTRVFLDGKTENGKTIYRNEDLTPHQHIGAVETTTTAVHTTNTTITNSNLGYCQFQT